MSETDLKNLTRTAPVAGSRWRHRKGGLYTIVTNAIREEDCSPVVVYRSDSGIVWVRPLYEFLDGRFTPLEGDE